MGVGSATLKFTIAPVTETQGYLISARGLLPSLKLLCASGGEHVRACALIAGFILECSLKAFIAHMKAVSARTPLQGHDLEALWVDALGLGLLIESPPPQWCATLNSLHYVNKAIAHTKKGRYPIRYQSGNHGLAFPVTADLLSGVETVFATVERACA